MLTKLFDGHLKSGCTMEVVRVEAPHPDLKQAILRFLEHKGPLWIPSMEEGLERGLSPLQMRFYLGRVDGEIIGNIMLIEALPQPVGILGHVFTAPEWRRQGVCRVLMEACTEDFKVRGGRALHLGTGYESPAYWIYHSFGFRSIMNTGAMRWFVEEDFEDRFFAPASVSVRETNWGDWPLLEALYRVTEGWFLRSVAMSQYIIAGYEGPYLELRRRMEKGAMKTVRVLQADGGAVVGHATLAEQPQWHGDPLLLDFFVHPNFYQQAGELLDAMELPRTRKVQCYADSAATEKMELLEGVGFSREATLGGQLKHDGQWLDVHCYVGPRSE